jgi:hypothetical protein
MRGFRLLDHKESQRNASSQRLATRLMSRSLVLFVFMVLQVFALALYEI